MELVAKRLDQAREIGRLKSAHRLPIRDFSVEAEVRRRVEQDCRRLGIEPRIGDEITQILIESAVKVQDSFVDRSRGGRLKHLLILGGAGQMGQWLCQFFHSQGHKVTVYDPRGAPDGFPSAESLPKAVEAAEVAVLSTPLRRSGELLQAVLDEKPTGLVFDICSLKRPVEPAIRAGIRAGLRVTSIHPMFGPDTALLMGRNILFCECGRPEATAEARDFFEGTTATLTTLPLEEHDALMAYVLGLSHAVNIACFTVLARSGHSFAELERAASTTFFKQTATSRDVARENAELYYEIQERNLHTPRVLEELVAAVEALRAASGPAGEAEFLKLMEEGKRYFGGS